MSEQHFWAHILCQRASLAPTRCTYPIAKDAIVTNNRLFAALAVSSSSSSARAEAQEFKVQGSSTNIDVLSSTNTSTATQDRRGVHRVSTPHRSMDSVGSLRAATRAFMALPVSPARALDMAAISLLTTEQADYAVYGYSPTAANNYAGYFNGNVYVSGSLAHVDLELKTNVQDVQLGTLGQVLRLRQTYRYLASASSNGLNLPTSDQVGFVAQDVAQVFPNLVTEVTVPGERGKPDEKFLSVDYIKVVPLLVKALQEQQAQIDALKAQVSALTVKADSELGEEPTMQYNDSLSEHTIGGSRLLGGTYGVRSKRDPRGRQTHTVPKRGQPLLDATASAT